MFNAVFSIDLNELKVKFSSFVCVFVCARKRFRERGEPFSKVFLEFQNHTFSY